MDQIDAYFGSGPQHDAPSCAKPPACNAGTLFRLISIDKSTWDAADKAAA